jgi:hypothetical protein
LGNITENCVLYLLNLHPITKTGLGNRKDRRGGDVEKGLPRVTLTLDPTLSRTKQERELRSVACVTTFQAAIMVSSFRRLALQ